MCPIHVRNFCHFWVLKTIKIVLNRNFHFARFYCILTWSLKHYLYSINSKKFPIQPMLKVCLIFERFSEVGLIVFRMRLRFFKFFHIEYQSMTNRILSVAIFVSIIKFFTRYLNTNIVLENTEWKFKYKYNIFTLHKNNVTMLVALFWINRFVYIHYVEKLKRSQFNFEKL